MLVSLGYYASIVNLSICITNEYVLWYIPRREKLIGNDIIKCEKSILLPMALYFVPFDSLTNFQFTPVNKYLNWVSENVLFVPLGFEFCIMRVINE